jgi:hypothetical protein
MKLGNSNAVIIDVDPFTQNTVQASTLGSMFMTDDNRTFRYGLSGAGALTAGNMGSEPAIKANHMAISPSAAAVVQQNLVSLTVGATAVVVGEYNEGWLGIQGTPGNGITYKVSNTPAVTSSGTGTFTLFDNIQVALTTGSVANLIHNPYNSTIEQHTVATCKAVGVPLVAVTASTSTAPNYYWAQTRGYASVLCDAATGATTGSAMVLSASVSGAITAMSTTFSTAVVNPIVGYNTLTTGTASKNDPILLTID